MKQKISILLLLCVVLLLPSVATAQSFFETGSGTSIFAQQNVAVWEIRDRNNDVKLSEAIKVKIRAEIEKAFTNSVHYKCYSYAVQDVKNELNKANLPHSPMNIAKQIRKMSIAKGEEHTVDYVIFTTLKIKQHGTTYNILWLICRLI